MSVSFWHHDKRLVEYVFPGDTPEQIREGIGKAHDQFRIDHPGVSLFDRVSTVFDVARNA